MKFDILLVGESEYLELIFSELFRNHRVYYSYNTINALNIINNNPVDIIIIQFNSSTDRFIKDAISIYPEVSIFLILEKDQVDEVMSKMDNILFEYVLIPCSWEEINSRLRIVFEICRLRKRYHRFDLFNIMTPYIFRAIRTLNLTELYRIVVDYLEKTYRYVIPIILESEQDNKFKIKEISKKGESILKGMDKKDLFVELSKNHLKPIINEKSMQIEGDISSSGILNNLKKEGFKKFYIFPLNIEDDTLIELFILACYYDEDIESYDIHLWKQLATKLSFIIGHINTLKTLNKVSEDLKQSQDIIMYQQRLNVLGQMASGISHDLNNIIFPIIGFTELVLDKEIGISKEGRKYLYQILSAAEDIRNIVSRLRQFYKKREEIENELELISVNEIVEEVVELTEAKWKKNSIDKDVDINVELKLSPEIKEIKGVKSEIREALINLIFNSVDALVNGGKIIISTQMEGDVVKLSVRDTGIGMDEATIEHCLEPFFTTKKEKGTGLGLSIVYGIVHRHGGDIKISSQLGKGTDITLIFPCAHQKKKVNQTDKEDVNILSPLKILYIDDEVPVTFLVRDILSADNHTVFVANDGEEGIRLFKEHINSGNPFDIIITDFVMPKLDGGKVASIIKSISPETPIILLTGWDLPESRLSKDIDLMLKKPVFPVELKKAISEVISEKQTHKVI